MIKPFPVAELVRTDRTERFASWVRAFGVFRLARSLAVDFRTVRFWLAGSYRPELNLAKQIIVLSSVEPLGGKPLTFEDIYGPAQAAKVEVRQVRKVQAWE